MHTGESWGEEGEVGEERSEERRRSGGVHVCWDGQTVEDATASNVGTGVLTLANVGKTPRAELILVTPCFHVRRPPQQTAITMRGS
jgi:hypothetical protein